MSKGGMSKGGMRAMSKGHAVSAGARERKAPFHPWPRSRAACTTR